MPMFLLLDSDLVVRAACSRLALTECVRWRVWKSPVGCLGVWACGVWRDLGFVVVVAAEGTRACASTRPPRAQHAPACAWLWA